MTAVTDQGRVTCIVVRVHVLVNIHVGVDMLYSCVGKCGCPAPVYVCARVCAAAAVGIACVRAGKAPPSAPRPLMSVPTDDSSGEAERAGNDSTAATGCENLRPALSRAHTHRYAHMP